MTHAIFCSFCGKNKTEVQNLIAGPTVFICNECVELCYYILRDNGTPIRPMVDGDLWSMD